MSTVEEIEGAITRLSESELSRLRQWFADYDQSLWDKQLERDASSGKLDKLADEALRDLDQGRCKRL